MASHVILRARATRAARNTDPFICNDNKAFFITSPAEGKRAAEQVKLPRPDFLAPHFLGKENSNQLIHQ